VYLPISLARSSLKKEGLKINEKDNANPARRKVWVFIGVITAISIFLGVLISELPGGFKTTHEQIGTGKPALVFALDPNLAVSASQTEQMNMVRERLGEQAFFLIAKIGTPDGDQLIAKYRSRPPELLLFDPSGRLIKRQFALIDANQLIQWLPVAAP